MSLDPYEKPSTTNPTVVKPLITVPDFCYKSFNIFYNMQLENCLCDTNILILNNDETNINGENRYDIVHVHKVVLASASSYFKALFANKMADIDNKNIELPGVRNVFVFKLLIEFLYTGKILMPTSPIPIINIGNLTGLPMNTFNLTPQINNNATTIVDEASDVILYLLELADLFNITPLFNACLIYLKQRICSSNVVMWLQFTSQLPNSTELYQSCLAYFCSHLNEFHAAVVIPFEFKLFKSVVSSECLRVEDEMQVFNLTALWLLAEDDMTYSPLSRIEEYGPILLTHIRFGRIPLLELESWFTRHHLAMTLPKEEIKTFVLPCPFSDNEMESENECKAKEFSNVNDKFDTMEEDNNSRAPSSSGKRTDDSRSFNDRSFNLGSVKQLYSATTQALLEQLSTPQLDADMLSTSGWANTRFYPISLYDRQSATVFKQTKDEGMIRAVVLSPDCSIMFTGSATTSSSELLAPPQVYQNNNGPEPCLKIWKNISDPNLPTSSNNNWQCVQSVPCGEDIVALAIQEYPPEVYHSMQVQYARALSLFAKPPVKPATSSSTAPADPLSPPNFQLPFTSLLHPAAVAGNTDINNAIAANNVTVGDLSNLNPEETLMNPNNASPFASLFQSVISILHNSNPENTPLTNANIAAATTAALDLQDRNNNDHQGTTLPPLPTDLPALPRFQLISAQLGRPSHHHTPKLRLRCWQYTPSEELWRPTKEIALSTAFVKNPVLFVIDNSRLLVGNYRTVQIWNTRAWVKEHEWTMDATLRSFVVCSCGKELIGRSVRDIRAWNMATWQVVRAMPAKLGGNHKAKLASCLSIYKNSLIFPMRDCIVCCDPHTGARLQRFSLPPSSISPPLDTPTTPAAAIMSIFQLSSPNVIPGVALADGDSWIMSSFVLVGDMLFVATYHGWLGIFSLGYDKIEEVAAPTAPLNEALNIPNLDLPDNVLVRLRCERFWQTAGVGVERGAVVNSVSVIMRSSDTRSDRSDSFASMEPLLSPNNTLKDVEDRVAGIVTVVDYGNSLTMWRKY